MPLLAALLLAACGDEPGPSAGEAARCRDVLDVIEPQAEQVELLRVTGVPTPARGATLIYRLIGGDGSAERFVTCLFAGGRGGRGTLVGVATPEGTLTDLQVYWVNRVLALGARTGSGPPAATRDLRRPGEAETGDTGRRPWLYLMQQALNATAVCCVYGLLAIGFTLVYGILGRINLAFGGVAMIGAVGAVIWTRLLGGVAGAAAPIAPLAGALAGVLATAAAAGYATERLAFRPLRGTRTQAVLIAAIGVALVLEESVRLLQGAGNFWLPQAFPRVLHLAGDARFPVTATVSQLLVVSLTLAIYGAVAWLRARTRFGRTQRAVADDPDMAGLLGVDVGRVVVLTFVLGSACAGAAGFVLAQHYGVTNFAMGFVTGFKALTAAILGGIGSVPGAMLGGLLLGLVETLWSAYFPVAYRDLVVFGVLAAVLVFRPQGLLGAPLRPRAD